MSKKQSKVDFNDNSKEIRSLELSTNVNDYDTGESLDCDNISETTSMEKMDTSKRSLAVKKGDKSRP
jgi:hypothetical protein